MGSISRPKLILLTVLFALTALLVYKGPSSRASKKSMPLAKALSSIPGWTMVGNSPLDSEIVTALKLDDYINASYSNGKDVVSLYIGYYLTSKKVGASHSPLVCMPGQGWAVSEKNIPPLTVKTHEMHIAGMVIERGEEKELILYWFQAAEATSSGTFLQKLYALWAKALKHGEDNAFVRVSIPMEKYSFSQAQEIGSAFIRNFYPLFLSYVRKGRA